VKRFRGGLVFKAHGLLYHSPLDSRVIKQKKGAPRTRAPAPRLETRLCPLGQRALPEPPYAPTVLSTVGPMEYPPPDYSRDLCVVRFADVFPSVCLRAAVERGGDVSTLFKDLYLTAKARI